ncbi:MAG: type II-A CRISPR-associated protein Csn2 [Erysipelotrichales bacterium]|nr:type II-A CRISPR-associated protein Csn2 [Erysipelotrichales bacterium]
MNFKHLYWDKHYSITSQEVFIIAIENSLTLWSYCTSLVAQSNGEVGFFSINKKMTELSFDKMCNVETNVPGISLNTKKIQTALIKKCVEFSARPEFDESLRNVSEILSNFCKGICQDIGYPIALEDDFDVAGVFKLFSITLRENYDSLLEKLIEYVNINIEFSKTKVFIFLFLSKFLEAKEMEMFFEHCRFLDVSIILLEDIIPVYFAENNIPSQEIIIDKDNFIIEKNVK